MNERTKLFFSVVFLFLICSCDLLRDSPFIVEAWTPGEGFINDPAGIRISLLLSHESDRARTEQDFSLTEDGKPLKGNFSWEGRRLVFLPASPLERDRDYFMSLGTGAQDVTGLSLESKFEASFTTRRPGGKLKVTGAVPEHDGTLAESRGEFRLFFSEPVTPDSCRDYISFNPSTPGSWRLEDENKSACFTPREPWVAGSLYRAVVDGEFRAASGGKLGTAYLTHFNAGTDREKPYLLKVLALNPKDISGQMSSGAAQNLYDPLSEMTAEEIPLEESGSFSGPEYSGWENFTRLCLVFSEPVDLSGLKNFLVTEPNAALVMESPPEFGSRAIFSLAGPVWGSSFHFRLSPGVKDFAGNESDKEYSFRIKTGGPYSRPPALVGIRLPMTPGKPGSPGPLSFSPGDTFAYLPVEGGEGHYPYMEEIPVWLELYFECAPDTEIDTFSIMDLFRVESTNRALEFSPGSIRTEDFTMPYPEEGWEHFRRIEIRGILTNTIHSGIVTFRIPPGLKDRRGNRSAVDFRLSLLK